MNTTSDFKAGDNVVLVEGPYQGISGVFLRLAKDDKWADIEEKTYQGTNHGERTHPVMWLRHA
jgi:transcription antitermination factor NusG